MDCSRQEGFTIWFTGMSGAGKSTLASYIGSRLEAAGKRVEVLDGDDAGQLLGYELGETRDERDLASRRVGYVAGLLSRNGVVAIGATISPYRALRDELRKEIGRFVEVFTDCDVETLIKRDVKGLYKRALSGELPHFIGITEPYEPPVSPEVALNSASESVQIAAERVIESLQRLGFLTPQEVQVALFGKAKEANEAKRKAARRAETAARAKGAKGATRRDAKSKKDGASPAASAPTGASTRPIAGRSEKEVAPISASRDSVEGKDSIAPENRKEGQSGGAKKGLKVLAESKSKRPGKASPSEVGASRGDPGSKIKGSKALASKPARAGKKLGVKGSSKKTPKTAPLKAQK